MVAPSPALALSAANLTFTDGDAGVLDDVSLMIERGQYLALVGGSGAGKTSLLPACAPSAGPFFASDTGTHTIVDAP